MLERVWRKGNIPTLLVRMQTGAATMENSVEISQKFKNRTTMRSSYSTSEYLSKEHEKKCKKILAFLCSLQYCSQ